MSHELKLKSLYAKKAKIQELESERDRHKAAWMLSGKRVRQLSQEINIKTKELLEAI